MDIRPYVVDSNVMFQNEVMATFKALFKFIYSALAAAVIIGLTISILDDPAKKINEYEVTAGVIESFKHVKYRGYKTYLNLAGSKEQYRLRLKPQKRNMVTQGADVKVWFADTLLFGLKVKQVSVNGVMLKKYDYQYVNSVHNKFIFAVCILLAGFIFLYGDLFKKLISKLST
ncbi:hypothetical protein A3766_11445 [Oleiphilus sp. HI0132]|uniref:hypothetical protein n=3 Tax=Oleiphilus TaxID=141450 RepID=UPI0007C3C5AA|nr:hypothetical protein [Oleiphilus sp. HI0132]KZZ78433.1 hypothetical protein A3766_11445 [Oleiphilus sp. HI0132]